MLRIRKFGENSCGYNAALWNCCLILRGYATMSFRQGYANGLGLTDRNFDRIGVRENAKGAWPHLPSKHFPGSSPVGLLPGVTYYFCLIHDDQDGTVWLRRRTAKYLDVQMRKVAKRLCQYERKEGRRTLQHEITFDTDFFEGEYQQHQYYLIEGHEGVWADNEVNYIGIGMYEAWLGHSLGRAAATTALWKLRYLDSPSNGTTYWLAYGHVMFETYYSKLDTCTCKFKDDKDVEVSDNERRSKGN